VWFFVGLSEVLGFFLGVGFLFLSGISILSGLFVYGFISAIVCELCFICMLFFGLGGVFCEYFFLGFIFF